MPWPYIATLSRAELDNFTRTETHFSHFVPTFDIVGYNMGQISDWGGFNLTKTT